MYHKHDNKPPLMLIISIYTLAHMDVTPGTHTHLYQITEVTPMNTFLHNIVCTGDRNATNAGFWTWPKPHFAKLR